MKSRWSCFTHINPKRIIYTQTRDVRPESSTLKTLFAAEAIRSLKAEKSQGEDNVPSEMIQHGGGEATTVAMTG